VAEVIRLYSNFVVPELQVAGPPEHQSASLEEQATGHAPRELSSDDDRPWRSNQRLSNEQLAEVLGRYETGESLSAIARAVGISWDSVARLLAVAGVRPR
jgi:hypothetical protein